MEALLLQPWTAHLRLLRIPTCLPPTTALLRPPARSTPPAAKYSTPPPFAHSNPPAAKDSTALPPAPSIPFATDSPPPPPARSAPPVAKYSTPPPLAHSKPPAANDSTALRRLETRQSPLQHPQGISSPFDKVRCPDAPVLCPQVCCLSGRGQAQNTVLVVQGQPACGVDQGGGAALPSSEAALGPTREAAKPGEPAGISPGSAPAGPRLQLKFRGLGTPPQVMHCPRL